MTYPPNDLFARFGTTPLPQKLPIAPIFIADSVSLAVSREKDGKLRLVYADRMTSRSSCSGRRHWLRRTVGPFMTVGPDPPRVIYGEPSTPLPNWSKMEAQLGLKSHKSPVVERSLCSIPWQDDFPRGNVPTGKGALRSIHWKLDDRPISMKLYEFAAIDGPEQTSAAEMHQRIIAMATE
jgi:hypothetical protein